MTDIQNSASEAATPWSTPRAPLRYAFSLLTVLPWIWLALFALFILLIAAQHGHLPVYGNPDPKDGGLYPLYLASVALIPLTFFTPLVWFGLLALGHWRGTGRSIPIRQTALYAAGMFLYFLIVVGDLGGLITWLVD
jgi:hypothetical protein